MFTAAATTTTARLGRFLAQLESQTNMAVRLQDLKIVSRKPGEDNLNVEMTVKALAYVPKKPEFKLDKPPAAGTTRPTATTGPLASGRTSILTITDPSYSATNYNNLLNAPLGSLDPGLPGTDETPMEERLRTRRQFQEEGKKLPKPRFGDEPLTVKPGETPEQALARRKEEQMKAAEAQAEALLAAEQAAAKKKVDEAALSAPKLLPGETMEDYLARKRKEQDAAPTVAPKTDLATTTQPATTGPGVQK